MNQVQLILLVCMGAILSLNQHVTYALRRPMRSVIRCDSKSSYVSVFSHENDCHTHCEQTYIRVSLDMILANRGISQAYIQEQPASDTKSGNPATRRECCCTFEAPWPNDLVQLSYINRQTSKITAKRKECLPIVFSVGLSKRTKGNYETLCKYYTKTEPLTVLELMQFAEAAAYLNYMHPKHPSILHLLSNKNVHRIQKEELGELREAMLSSHLLLDTYLPLEHYDGYQLRTKRFRHFLELKKYLSRALKSQIVAQAIDELIISNMMVDIAAAAMHIQEINMELELPESLIRGDYDKYDPNLGTYFTLPQTLDCKKVISTRDQLNNYLTIMKSLSNMLNEKLIYEHMLEKCPSLIEVLHAQEIYRNVIKVNCAVQHRG